MGFGVRNFRKYEDGTILKKVKKPEVGGLEEELEKDPKTNI